MIKSLDNELEKPHWSQWVPFSGPFKMLDDGSKNRPQVVDKKTNESKAKYISRIITYDVVHISTQIGFLYGALTLMDKYLS
jgi:hypothetical protein